MCLTITPISVLSYVASVFRGAVAGVVGGPVFSRLCESGANVCSLGSQKTTPA